MQKRKLQFGIEKRRYRKESIEKERIAKERITQEIIEGERTEGEGIERKWLFSTSKHSKQKTLKSHKQH